MSDYMAFDRFLTKTKEILCAGGFGIALRPLSTELFTDSVDKPTRPSHAGPRLVLAPSGQYPLAPARSRDHEARDSSELRRDQSRLQLRQRIHDPLYARSGSACRGVLVVPSVLYRQAEDGRQRWPRRQVPQALQQGRGELSPTLATNPA